MPTSAPSKLPVLRTAGTAYAAVFTSARLFMLTAIPALCVLVPLYCLPLLQAADVVIVKRAGVIATSEDDLPLAYRLWWLLEFIPYALFAPVWLHLHLKNASRPPSLRSSPGLRRAMLYLKGGLLLLLLWVPFIHFLPIAIVELLEFLRVLGYATLTTWRPGLEIVSILLSIYLLTRVSLMVAADAAGEPVTLRAAWRMTEGNCLRLLAAYLLAGLPLYILAAFVWASLAPGDVYYLSISQVFAAALIGATVLLAAAAVFVAVTAQAFSTLTGGPGAQSGILERFD